MNFKCLLIRVSEGLYESRLIKDLGLKCPNLEFASIDVYEPNKIFFEELSKNVFEHKLWGEFRKAKFNLINEELTLEISIGSGYDLITAFHLFYFFPDRKAMFMKLFNSLRHSDLIKGF